MTSGMVVDVWVWVTAYLGACLSRHASGTITPSTALEQRRHADQMEEKAAHHILWEQLPSKASRERERGPRKAFQSRVIVRCHHTGQETQIQHPKGYATHWQIRV